MTMVLKVDCRACSRECGDYKHLQDETVIDEESTTLAALLHYCTTLECFVGNRDIGMPEHICNSCVEHLLQSYLFKEMVLQNDRAFRERLKAKQEERQQNPMETAKAVSTEECHQEQEIDVGGVEEQSLEEFVAGNDENAENAQADTEFEIEEEEWLELEEVQDSAMANIVAKEEIVVDEDDNIVPVAMSVENMPDSVTDENILPDSIPEKYVKIEDCDDTEDVRYELLDEDGFIITATTEDFEIDSNAGEALRGFEDNNEVDKEAENYDQQEVEMVKGENELQENVVKRRSIKTNGLTEADLTCEYCGKVFDKMCRLREHSYMHTGEKPHVCQICGKKSRTKTHYNVHMLTHSDEKRYKCSICGQYYRTSTSLRVHERKHSDIRPYACHLCDKSFHTAEQKKLHLMLHTGERPFSCGICGKSYRENHSLKLHMQSHDDKKPYECEVCGKGLTQLSGYKRHMLLHTNEYPFKCDICGRPFRISSNLAAHKRLHLNILPYQCNQCDKGFNNSTRLKRHMAKHEETKTNVFKPRKQREEVVTVDSRVAKSNVVEII